MSDVEDKEVAPAAVVVPAADAAPSAPAPADKMDTVRMVVLLVLQILAIVWFAVGAEYSRGANTTAANEIHSKDNAITSGPDDAANAAAFGAQYPAENLELSSYLIFSHIQLMVFVGFGLLMGTLRSYGYVTSSTALCFGAVVMQWGVLLNNFFSNAFNDEDLRPHFEWMKVQMSMNRFLEADYGIAALLISLGAVLGKVSLDQAAVMTAFHMIFYALNHELNATTMAAADVGGTVTVHMFGAYFGLAASAFVTDKSKSDGVKGDGAQNQWALFGTLLMWILFPSWNLIGAGDSNGAASRVVVNTLLALSTSTTGAYTFSKILRPGNKFDMADVQKSTLAGGVAVGACSNLMLHPWGAMVVGLFGGLSAILAAVYVQPFLEGFGMHDSTGVGNLHGFPGLVGGIACWLAVLTLVDEDYVIQGGDDASRATDYADQFKLFPHTQAEPHKGRSLGDQATAQILGVVITLALSLVGGAVTGLAMTKIPGVSAAAKYMAVDDYV